MAKISTVACEMELSWKGASKFKNLDRKTFAECVDTFPYKDFLFVMYDDKYLNALEYIMSKPTSQILKMIKKV